jgi:hypothetical protein
LAGILAGLLGSIIITVIGVTFLKLSGLITVIVVSLILMFFINPRYVCMAYSGGILSLAALILTALISRGYIDKNNTIVQFFQNSLDFDVTSLMMVVSIMHLMESILMWFDGHRGAVPVFLKREGKLVGGFVMQRLWVIPILFLILASSSGGDGQSVATPQWWPLFGSNIPQSLLKDAAFSSMSLLAMLGYSDFALSTPVLKKVRRSSIELFIFSITLLILSLLSYKLYAFKFIAAIFAPLAHEGLILYERFKESSGVPLWEYSDDGVIVVDTIPSSPAEHIGIKSGDKLIQINNNPIKTIEDVINIMGEYLNYMWIEVIDLKGQKRLLELSDYRYGINELGIITVPKDDGNVVFVEQRSSSLIKGFISKFRK